MASASEPARRGRLTVYLGAAPGVGKTFAMLDEAHRRRARGTDVVVGLVETHGRAQTAQRLEGLETIPRRRLRHRGADFDEMDTAAILARRPAVVLVDELAHTNVPGSERARRVDDVEVLRAAGIDVVTTINIQHLASLNDEVERITGVRQRETVPDEVVRTAEQIQLVDMAPEALRRRLAHGNVYRPESIDASLTSYFRVGNLTALRELALLWLADRVDDALGDYRRAHRIAAPWPARERIVVAVTGGPESATLLRRGARLAQRSAGAELIALHVVATDGLRDDAERHVAAVQQQVEALGGSYHAVAGEDVARAVVDFAAGVNATMIVVGLSRHGRLRRLVAGSTVDRIAASAGAVDVHLVGHEQVGRLIGARPRLAPLDPRRQAAGWLAALVLPVAIGTLLHGPEVTDDLPLASLMLLAGTVLVALLGGVLPALAASVVSFVVLNLLFTRPYGDLTVAEPRNALTLLVFTAVAAAVAGVVDRASRRAVEARRARTEAATTTALSRSVLTGEDTAEAIVARVREVFGQRAVALVRTQPDGAATTLAVTGDPGAAEAGPGAAATTADVDAATRLALWGDPLSGEDRRVLEAFAVQAGLVLEYRRLRERAERAAVLESADSTATAVLRAVSHDLRTPLATVRAGLDGLMAASPTAEAAGEAAAGAAVSAAERAELVEAVVEAAAELERLIDDLLDLSRLQTGLVRPVLQPRSLEEVLPLAVAGHPAGTVELDADETTPPVLTDAGLLERALANLVSNAVRAARGEPVRVGVHTRPDAIEIHVVDRGPGVPPEQREAMFEPFSRLGDAGGPGLGLGLAVARGLCTAVGGTLEAEETVGGGLTMVVTVPRAPGGAAESATEAADA